MVFTTEDYKGGDRLSASSSVTSGFEEGAISNETTVRSLDSVSKVNKDGRGLTVTVSAENLDIGSAIDLAASNEEVDAIVEERTDEEDEKDVEAPDGGYGWLVVLASFLSHVMIGGMERSDGIYFLMFQSEFNKSAALTAWPGAVASMLRLAMGPIASALCQQWSVRACCMVGGLALGVVQILSAFSGNFYFLFVSHGVLQGVARGLLYCPSLILVNMYFNKRRSLATGLAASGVGMGTLVMVPLVQFLFDTYGFSGGFLVLGAISFHGVVFAMLYRPLFLHHKFIGKKGSAVEKPTTSETLMLSEMTDAADTASLRSIRLRSDFSIHQEDKRASREASHELLQPSLSAESSRDNQLKIISSHSPCIPPSQVKKEDGCLKSTLYLLFPRENTRAGNKKEEKTKLFHFELLRDPAFFSFCLSIGVFTATFKSTFTFIPALAESRGLTKTEGVLILSLSGVVDTFGRVISGFFLDRPAIQKRRLAVYSCIQFVIAGLCALMPIIGANFAWLCVTCSLFGMLTGVIVSQKSVLCVDLLDAKRMPSAFGILLLFQAVGTGVGPLIAGACRDAFGRFHEAFFFGAGLMALSACFMVYSTIVHTISKNKEHRSNPLC